MNDYPADFWDAKGSDEREYCYDDRDLMAEDH